MNEKLLNWFALIGAILTAIGQVLITAASDTAMWWGGKILIALGPALMGARALFAVKNPSDPKP